MKLTIPQDSRTQKVYILGVRQMAEGNHLELVGSHYLLSPPDVVREVNQLAADLGRTFETLNMEPPWVRFSEPVPLFFVFLEGNPSLESISGE